MVALVAADVLSVMSGGSYRSRWIADAFYDGRATFTGMSVTASGSIDGDAGSEIQTTASIVVEADTIIMRGQGKTIIPTSPVDALATYGQEIVLSKQVWFGQQIVGTVPYGRFRISEAPKVAVFGRKFGQTNLFTGEHVELHLDDRFEPIQAAKFSQFTSPKTNATVWSEIRRISPFPVTVNPLVPNSTIATSMVYDSDRLKTITDIFAVAGAEPSMTRDGSLTARPTDPVAAGVSAIDLSGTMQPFTRSISNDFYNHVIVTATVNGTASVIAEAMITDGPLSVNGPAGHRVYERSSGLVDTAVGAQNLANSVLKAQMMSRASEVQIACLPDLRVELGDPVTGTDPSTGETVTGLVSKLSHPISSTGLMTATIQTGVYV